MCGRCAFTTSKEKINKHFGFSIQEELTKSYNIAPTQKMYIITNDLPKSLQTVRWGLIPHWVTNSGVGDNLINARAETIATKASFRIPIRQKRCLVLADSFYEWKTYGRAKLPHRIVLKENTQLMVFAGIWDEWRNESGNLERSFSIITTRNNEEMSWLHDRMPVILQTLEQQQRWLQDLPLPEVLAFLKPLPDNSLRIYPVSEKINQVGYNAEDLFQEVKTPPTLFDFS